MLNPEKDTILALETATPVCSVALYRPGKPVLSRTETGMGIHSEKTFLFTDELLAKAGIEMKAIYAVVVSGGPGSYTGLRIAASAAKGLLFGTEIKLISVSTMAAIAMGAVGKRKKAVVHAVINARRTHLYHRKFSYTEKNGLRAETAEEIRPLEEIRKMLNIGDILAGTGIRRLSGLEPGLVEILEDDNAMRAENLVRLAFTDSEGRFCTQTRPEDYEPVYQVEI